jgi:hypothetical protein
MKNKIYYIIYRFLTGIMNQPRSDVPDQSPSWPDLAVPMEAMTPEERSFEIRERRRKIATDYANRPEADAQLVDALGRYTDGSASLAEIREAASTAQAISVLDAVEDLERYAELWSEIGRRQRIARRNHRRAKRTDRIISGHSIGPISAGEEIPSAVLTERRAFGRVVSAQLRADAESVPAFVGNPSGDRAAKLQNDEGFDQLESIWNTVERRGEALGEKVIDWWMDNPVSEDIGLIVMDAVFPGWEERGDTVSADEADVRACMALASTPSLVFPEWNSVPALRQLVGMMRVERARQYAAFAARGEYARRAGLLVESDAASIESSLNAIREADRSKAAELAQRRERRESIPKEKTALERETKARIEKLQSQQAAMENARPRAFRRLAAFAPGRLDPDIIKGASLETIFGWIGQSNLEQLLEAQLEVVRAQEIPDESLPSEETLVRLLASSHPELIPEARDAWNRRKIDHPAIARLLDRVIDILEVLCIDSDRHMRSGTLLWRQDALEKNRNHYLSAAQMAEYESGKYPFYRIHPIFRFWRDMMEPLKR